MNKQKYEKAMDLAFEGLRKLLACGLESGDHETVRGILHELLKIDLEYLHLDCYCLKATDPDWPCAYCGREKGIEGGAWKKNSKK